MEGGFLVRGTLDPVAALGLALADGGGDVVTVTSTDPVDSIAAGAYWWLRRARPGRYRVVPVNPRAFDDCTWRTWPCNPGGGRNQRGTFDAVEFTP
jgi:hypothetical protein